MRYGTQSRIKLRRVSDKVEGLTEETCENLGCFLCLAGEGETLHEIARASGNTRRALFDERSGLDACSLGSPLELVKHRHRCVQLECVAANWRLVCVLHNRDA